MAFRLRLANDLHDDLGSDLSSLALASEMLAASVASDGETRDQLHELRHTTLRMIDSLRDVVWSMNPVYDNLDAMVSRMRWAADRLLPGVDHAFEALPPSKDRVVPMEVRRTIYLVYKEALHNIQQHAAASHVATRLERRGDRLTLRVEDDGVGFDIGVESAGHGLSSMNARALEAAGTLRVTSRPGAGTTIELETPI